ncbi:MAG: hypothetical protein ACFFEX_10150 [Candidatus Thorarchaeota archaeon]
MSIRHELELIRVNKQARQGFVTSIILILILMGWMAIAYARVNPYLLVLSFPIFNSIFILAITLFLIRAENEALVRLKTIPGGLKRTLLSAITLSLIVVIILNGLFEVLAVGFQDFLVDAFGSALPPVDYIPDVLTLITFIGCNISFSICFGALGVWIFSQSKVTPGRGNETIARLEGFLSSKLLMTFVLLGVAFVFIAFGLQSVIASVEGSSVITPVLVVILSFGFNVILSWGLWTNAWRKIDSGL